MGSSLSLAERHEWWGKWWTPDKPDEKFGGLAVYDPARGITLRLTGGFDYRVFDEPAPGVKSYSGQTRDFPVVLGSVGSTLITLLDCMVSSSSGPLFDGDRTDQTLISAMLLQGCHLLSADDAAFIAVSVSIENLPRWTQESSITGRISIPEGGSQEQPSATYEIGPTEDKEAHFGGNRFVLSHSYSIPHLRATKTRHEAILHEEPSLKVEFPALVSVDKALAPVGQLRDLVTLAIGQPCGTIKQSLLLPPDPDGYPEKHPYATHRRAIQVLAPQSYQAKPDSEPVPDHEVLFTLKDIPFADVVPRWLEVHSRFRAAANILLGLQYNSEQYLETRTISAVAAAESFHRALGLRPPIPNEEFAALLRALLDATPKQHRSLVRDRLQRNEPSLKARLLDLVNRLDTQVADRLVPDRETWAKLARDSRNNLAHEGSAESHDLNRLYAVTEVTAAVVMVNLLQELGVPNEKIASKITENRTLSGAARLGRENLQGPEQGNRS